MHQDSAEDVYLHVSDYQEYDSYSEREKLAIEYAERFALDHLSLNEEFFKRLKEFYSDKEIIVLTASISTFLAFGRMMKVLDLSVTKPLQV
jgi:alkylhydroperoxidase family enzyme